MATHPRGNGTIFDRLRYSCDISSCDLSPERNQEKYRSSIKSSIGFLRISCSDHPQDAIGSPWIQLLLEGGPYDPL